ncbi:hypothetical protein SUDANB121_00713 [Nocardiopsis dassonvillei]|jgi:hypothetical protein|uniref:hypothetical protein n=1 Tax=Nocardiopsis dassonvillei TaxID=2014 RepID=UPI003F55B284
MLTLLALVAFKALDVVAQSISNWGMTMRLSVLLVVAAVPGTAVTFVVHMLT